MSTRIGFSAAAGVAGFEDDREGREVMAMLFKALDEAHSASPQ